MVAVGRHKFVKSNLITWPVTVEAEHSKCKAEREREIVLSSLHVLSCLYTSCFLLYCFSSLIDIYKFLFPLSLYWFGISAVVFSLGSFFSSFNVCSVSLVVSSAVVGVENGSEVSD
jgi:hypothetical protein